MIDDFTVPSQSMRSRVLQIEAVANNLANASTVGFKKDKLFGDVLDVATADAEKDLRQVIDFQEGFIRATNNPLDVALAGDGFFAVETAEGVRYTRNGHFRLDDSGRLSLEDGSPVLGEHGPIEVNGKLTITKNGDVYQGKTWVDRLQLVTFSQPYPLRKVGNTVFALKDESVAPQASESVQVNQGFLEDSNVNPIEEMVDMMTLYRYFEADQKTIRARDELLSRAVNDIGKVV